MNYSLINNGCYKTIKHCFNQIGDVCETCKNGFVIESSGTVCDVQPQSCE